MISKERLEELIKQGKTIWRINNKVIEKIVLANKQYEFSDNGCLCLLLKDYDIWGFYSFETLFEYEKQAEWALKYHATRTEKLDLPMWEDVKDAGFDYIFFVKKGDVDFEYYFLVGEQDKSIQIMSRQIEHIMLNYGYDIIYNKKLTKENYIEACDLCLKLFKGEEK